MKFFAPTSSQITESEKKHGELVRSRAGECVVLLENHGVLPYLGKGNLALYGNGARATIKGGTGSGDVNTRESINIEQGLEAAGFSITTKNWLARQQAHLLESREAYGRWLKEEAARKGLAEFAVNFDQPFREPAVVAITQDDLEASEADTAIYVLARNSGEGADRHCAKGDYLLFDEEEQQLRQLAEYYRNVILVLNIGGVMDLTGVQAIPGIGAVLLLSQLGHLTGHIFADVLTGKVTPSGKLVDTWARDYMDYPSSATFSHNDNNVTDEYYTEGIYVGYRYFDTFGVRPLYPFGFGRSYTDFSITVDTVKNRGSRISASVRVKNTGASYAGKEVVQAYVSAPASGLDKPCQELAAYEKTKLLAPGEEQSLTLCFDLRRLASYSEEQAAYLLEAGAYVLRIGNSSAQTTSAAVLDLTDTVIVYQVKNVFGKVPGLQEIRPENREEAAVAAPVSLTLRPTDFPQAKEASYSSGRALLTTGRKQAVTAADIQAGTATVEELAAQLSVEELAGFCAGTFRTDEGSVVGNASAIVPGAAGDSTAALSESRGIKPMIMADGPAGLRLQPVFKATKEGEMIPGGDVLGDVYRPFPEDLDEADTVTYYQYTTAIPIGWALAQSWNRELLEELGSMVGSEMEQFGVDIWLAPALNIHRNPLCGRNFEYYSEDPLISGSCAAAITKGVQSHRGKGTCIKHFAVNNQEDNRYFTNSFVSERALREIYLKGFEIAVRESAPLSIMTSYNLLNGTHTANHFGLLQSVCRDEWGYDGMIMTDWFTSQKVEDILGIPSGKYSNSASTGCAKAGNDIQMPGCKKNVEDLIRAVESGEPLDGYTVTLADLQFCAANVIRAALRTM